MPNDILWRIIYSAYLVLCCKINSLADLFLDFIVWNLTTNIFAIVLENILKIWFVLQIVYLFLWFCVVKWTFSTFHSSAFTWCRSHSFEMTWILGVFHWLFINFYDFSQRLKSSAFYSSVFIRCEHATYFQHFLEGSWTFEVFYNLFISHDLVS